MKRRWSTATGEKEQQRKSTLKAMRFRDPPLATLLFPPFLKKEREPGDPRPMPLHVHEKGLIGICSVISHFESHFALDSAEKTNNQDGGEAERKFGVAIREL